jgi:hypothetical protein
MGLSRRALVAVLALLLLPSPALAASGPVVDEGLSASPLRGGGWTLHASGKARAALAAIAGKHITVGCGTVRDPAAHFGDVTTESSTITTVLRRPARVVSIPLSGSWDVCFVRTAGRKARLVAEAGVSDRGHLYLDERSSAAWLVIPSHLTPDSTRPLSTDAMVAKGRGFIVELSGPDDSPPPKHVGYWSDGDHRAVTAVLTSAGRRLFLDIDNDRTSTNALPYLTNQDRDY